MAGTGDLYTAGFAVQMKDGRTSSGDLHTAGFAVQGESPLSRLPDICSSDKLQSTNQGREQNCPAFTGQCFRLSLEFVAASCLLLCIFFVNSSTGSRLTTLLTMLIQQHWICPQKKGGNVQFLFYLILFN